MTIGEKVQYLRTYNEISREDLADKVGVSKTSIYNYETNRREISLDLLEKIAKVLDFPLSEIVSSDDITFEDTVSIYYKDIDLSEEGDEYFAQLYIKHFSELLDWKLSYIKTDYEFFKLVLTWYKKYKFFKSISDTNVDELSSLFARELLLRDLENKHNKVTLDSITDNNERIRFLCKQDDTVLTSKIKHGETKTILDHIDKISSVSELLEDK